MGFLPQLSNTTPNKEFALAQTYTGYNHNLISEYRSDRSVSRSFYDEKNMSSDLYPVIAPRGRRGIVRSFTKPHGLHAHDRKLAWVDGTSFYYDGSNLDGSNNAMTVEDSDKQMISMGAYVLIWPDKKYYNSKTGEFGPLEATWTAAANVTAVPSLMDGSQINPTVAAVAPANPADGDYWVDTTQTPHVLRRYSATLSMWNPIATTYVKISGTGIGSQFTDLDGVTISNCPNADFNGSFVIFNRGADYIVVVGQLDAAATWTYSSSDPLKIKRDIPDMEYLTESENRIWGCNSDNHEIYACALGDPFNWNKFNGVSTDSYALTVGSGGRFTGAITHLGYVLFFKEDVIHRLYGNKPANYQLTNINARGVRAGSGLSPVIVNETLFYHSKSDVCGFASSLPQSISDPLGSVKYTEAVGGTDSKKYYVSLKDEDDNWTLFTYDIDKGMWHKEDDTHMLWTANIGTDMYYIGSDNKLYSVAGNITDYADSNAALENKVPWLMETGPIGLFSPDHKWITKIQIRYETDIDTEMEVWMQYDNHPWERKFYMTHPQHLGSDLLTILPYRCDTAKMKIVGRGGIRIYSITHTIEGASEK